MTNRQNDAVRLKEAIQMVCVAYGLNLTVHDGKIGFVDQQANKIIALWEPEFKMPKETNPE